MAEFREILLSGTAQSIEDLKERLQLIVQAQPGDPLPDLYRCRSKLAIPNDKVGLIIGKGGSTIREIQMETGCKVLIPDPSSNGNTRELEIMGPSDDLVARCEELVKQCTKVVDPIELSDGMSVAVVSEVLRVPDNKVGLIIGRGGSTIRTLMQESGAMIDIPKDNLIGKPYREITLKGTVEAIARCKVLVHQTITPWHEQQQQKGGIPPQPEQGDRTSSQRPRHEDPHYDMHATAGRPAYIPDPMMYYAQPMPIPTMGRHMHEAPSIILPIPADRVGLVVGKGGSTIRHIQEISKTHVHVPPAVYGASVCNVQISGMPDQIAVCTAMIQQCIAPLNPGGVNHAMPHQIPLSTIPIDTIVVQIPAALVPFITGPNLEFIPLYEEQTGAQLFLANSDLTNNLQDIVLRGPRPQVMSLQQMLRMRLSMLPPLQMTPTPAPEPGVPAN